MSEEPDYVVQFTEIRLFLMLLEDTQLTKRYLISQLSPRCYFFLKLTILVEIVFFQIMDWLSKQAEINKDIMELHTIGKTYEKRELKVVKLCNFPGKIS